MSDKEGDIKSVIMRPRARLISLLGDELISDEPVAVVELVKNAYDADATEVSVTFETNRLGQAERLVIRDNGHGMSLDGVIGGWFEPGTVMKKQKVMSPNGRLYQGAKGVGRFAAARLGESLILETKDKLSDEYVTVLLEWGKFDDDSYLDDIEITYENISSPSTISGTTLTIEGLDKRKVWEENDFKILHDRLSRLISPFEEVNDFKLELNIPNHPELTGEVEPHSLTKQPIYSFKGSISESGELNAKFDSKLSEKKEFKEHRLGNKGETVECGGFEFEIRVWDRDREGLSPYMLEYNQNISSVRGILDTYCGVSIYRDGFRVHPYGQTGDDWLSLDNRSRQNPTTRLAKNQVIASIKTSRTENENLIDRTTREGLVHNKAYEQLITWFLRIITILEEERYKLRPREDGKPEYTTSLFEAFDMSDVVSEANKQLGKSHAVTKLVKHKDLEIRTGVKKLQDHYSRVLLAAGLGQLVDLVIHEIGAPLGRINREINHLVKQLEKLRAKTSNENDLSQSFSLIKGWLEQIGNLRARLDPKTAGKRGRATSFDVADEIMGNLNLYENLLAKQGVKVSFKQPNKPVIVHMSRSNLGQIIANLIDNSVFWLTQHHGDGRGGNINLQLIPIKGGFKILYCDDGPGIPEQDIERVFDQYFSTKPNGMGLGLYIARQIIEPYGKLLINNEGELTGAAFELFFERKVGVSGGT